MKDRQGLWPIQLSRDGVDITKALAIIDRYYSGTDPDDASVLLMSVFDTLGPAS